MPDSIKISDITHPNYDIEAQYWDKYRDTYESGPEFINEYLTKYSSYETDTDFANRKLMTYVPAHAKRAINSIKNAIFLRMIDIVRADGPKTYQNAIDGLDGGVDNSGTTMNRFIGEVILPELLVMRRVGIFVDKAPQEATISQAEAVKNHPYIYYYPAEDIRSWSFDNNKKLTSLLLRNNTYTTNEFGLPIELVTTFALYMRTIEGVIVRIFDEDGTEIYEQPFTLKLKEIPFVMFELTHSLMREVAEHQIALLNLASSNFSLAWTSGFPLYTEQYNPAADMAKAAMGGNKPVELGPRQGRRYPAGLERPGFVNASSEPLVAGRDFCKDIENEIYNLVHINVATLTSRHASSESKEHDERDLEAGLATIGMELEAGERQIAKIWAMYEEDDSDTTIKYPLSYAIKTDTERREEAKGILELSSKIPSETYQKMNAKHAARILLAHKISAAEMTKIEKEIDAAPVINSDPETVIKDWESGFVSTETASKIRGYPEGEVEQAEIDHAKRAARIVKAQTAASGKITDPKARGDNTLDNNPNSPEEEKKAAEDSTLED